MTQSLERAAQLAEALEGVSILNRSPEYVLLGLEGARQTLGLLEIEPGWLSMVAELVPWSEDPDVDVMLGLFSQSWEMGVFRPLVTSSGLMIRADVLAGEHLDDEAITGTLGDAAEILRHLSRDMTQWPEIVLRAPTPGNLRAWMERAPFQARYVGEHRVWRVPRTVNPEDDRPVVVSFTKDEHALSLIYGLEATLDEDLEFLMSLMELNDQFVGAKLVWSEERALMLMLEIPRARLTEFGFLAWVARFDQDIEVARAYVSDRTGDLLGRLQELRALLVAYQRSHEITDEALGRRLRRLWQDLEVEPIAGDAELLDVSLRQVLDIMFGVIVPARPRAEALFPMQLELMERGASDIGELLDLMLEYAWLERA